ncbi:hypothetical protein Nepgr_009850 [Nepenthes gracilis]|uniref:Dicer-like 3 n=1 Tax=Nepenthes gracilis TaxID=150966 RepID=A0AAD3XKS0_NEPGR|nr:hypothetical protein Nepgr_009850 [Nepenthes gracilis]
MQSFDKNTKPDPMELDTSKARPKDFTLRSYQKKIYEVARKRNVLAALETGAGKTMIAVMLIKEIGEAIKSSAVKKVIVFLATTVSLVNQQYEVIKIYTDLRVKEIYGALGVDEWNTECWKKQINDCDVMVMTPQIFLDALRNAFLTMETVCLMIFDECHRATGNHNYARIMKEFYHKSVYKPKIFGMTATPVIRKGVSSIVDCEEQLSELQSLLDSQICSIDDKIELEQLSPPACEIFRFYHSAKSSSSALRETLQSLWFKYDASFIKWQESLAFRYKHMDGKLKTLRRRLSTDHEKILYCLDNLGLLCAHEAVKVCLENSYNIIEDCELHAESSSLCKLFLEGALNAIGDFLPQGRGILTGCGPDMETVNMNYVSPKLDMLLQISQMFRDDNQVLCLILVERIMAAKAIERFLRKINSLSHFSISYLTGCSSSVDALTPKMQKQNLELFRTGKVNLLFATDMVEEGIHVPSCTCVVHFDMPKTVRSYVQSRGCARQNNSLFIMMLERNNKEQRDQLFDIIRSEHAMSETAMNGEPDPCTLRAGNFSKASAYVVEATGASISADSSVTLIRRYCEKLPSDKYYGPKPVFQILSSGGSYECKVMLPPNAAFQTIIGPPSRSSHLSKQLVCLEACKKLHQMGALDDYLVPCVEGAAEGDSDLQANNSAAGAGTTKRKELHGTTRIRVLSGTWIDKPHGATFHAYGINFSCNIPSRLYSGFVLLTESKLDDDVANAKVDLYLLENKIVKSSIFSCGQISLDANQIKRAMSFHELFFNGLFGKIFQGSKARGIQREFLLHKDNKLLWSPCYMYLILPLESSNIQNSGSWSINWKGIDSCVSVIEFLKKSSWLSAEDPQGSMRSLPTSRNISENRNFTDASVICLANASYSASNLKDTVVMAIHTGRIYSVSDVLVNTSADSPFDRKAYSQTSYTSFSDYFQKKYGIALSHPGQPLLLLKQSHNPHNLLVDFNSKDRCKVVVEKKRNHVHMPPELLVSLDVAISVLKASYLLPSLMHRLESLMLASQLRDEIAFNLSNVHIPSFLILEALTTLRCCEKFSLERLELLGDSVLKYAVSCHLFLKYPEKHEGQLSARRSWAVCNATLHKLGTIRKLQGYIRDSAFEPRRFVAPGLLSIHPIPCSHGVDILEVPLDTRFQTISEEVMVGKCCDMGHRWMCSKTIADCVEALVGAFYVGGGLMAALHFMKWLGVETSIEHSYLDDTIHRASLLSYTPKSNDIRNLETKIGYEFSVKGLLLEAITHASEQESGVGYCYQRLEFLGDSVLDVLITQHLYQAYLDIDPGELTDLRSASVNNENFAQVAVRRNLYPHLQHSSGLLLRQVTEYVKLDLDDEESAKPLQGRKGPKALGDLVESIAGAILIDTKLDLNEVWRIFEPLLSPIVTPDKLELPPLRQLNELCDSLGYFIKENCINDQEMVHVELRLQLKDILIIGEGIDKSRKTSKGQAAVHLLKDLQSRGITYSQCVSKRRKQESLHVSDLSTADLRVNNWNPIGGDDFSEHASNKKQKTCHLPRLSSSLQNACCVSIETLDWNLISDKGKNTTVEEEKRVMKDVELTGRQKKLKVYVRRNRMDVIGVDALPCQEPLLDLAPSSHLPTPVIPPVNMQKGGPRTSLYELCRRLHWIMPEIKSTEDKSRMPIVSGEGSEKRHGVCCFVSEITLHIPNVGEINVTGEPRTDKRSAHDSAALVMLLELQHQGMIVIGSA